MYAQNPTYYRKETGKMGEHAERRIKRLEERKNECLSILAAGDLSQDEVWIYNVEIQAIDDLIKDLRKNPGKRKKGAD